MRISDWSSDVCSSDPAAKGELLCYLLGHSRVSVLIVEEDLLPRAEDYLRKSDAIHTVIVVPGPTGDGAGGSGGLTTMPIAALDDAPATRSEEPPTDLQSLLRNSSAVFSLPKQNYVNNTLKKNIQKH